MLCPVTVNCTCCAQLQWTVQKCLFSTCYLLYQPPVNDTDSKQFRNFWQWKFWKILAYISVNTVVTNISGETIYYLPTWCTDYYLFIKYYSSLHVLSLKCSSFRRIQLYTCSIWYCHSLWEFLVACRYTAWARTALQFSLKLCTNRPPGTLIESDSTICCMYTTVSSWKMSTWGSKHVEENIILWINNNQCIKLVNNI